MAVLGQNRGRGGAMLIPMNSYLLLRVARPTPVPFLAKIESVGRPTETRSDRDKLNS